jgi:hypothetical protein
VAALVTAVAALPTAALPVTAALVAVFLLLGYREHGFIFARGADRISIKTNDQHRVDVYTAGG